MCFLYLILSSFYIDFWSYWQFCSRKKPRGRGSFSIETCISWRFYHRNKPLIFLPLLWNSKTVNVSLSPSWCFNSRCSTAINSCNTDCKITLKHSETQMWPEAAQHAFEYFLIEFKQDWSQERTSLWEMSVPAHFSFHTWCPDVNETRVSSIRIYNNQKTIKEALSEKQCNIALLKLRMFWMLTSADAYGMWLVVRGVQCSHYLYIYISICCNDKIVCIYNQIEYSVDRMWFRTNWKSLFFFFI